MTDSSLPGAWSATTIGDAASGDDFADTQPAHLSANTLRIAFTGSGSEYFRIWIVNLLLTLVTLGIYYPWAKVRRLRYFHGNTLVGGEPLGYHADPKKMLKGYALVSLMLVLYSVAGKVNAIAGIVAFVLVMLIWPALLKSSMQFRLANTSWRGLRLRFAGDLQGAYMAVLPLFVPALFFVVAGAAIPDKAHPPAWYGYFFAAIGGAMALTFPWLFKRLKDYQHSHYVLASQRTRFEATTGAFYKLYGKVLAIYLVGALAVGALATGIAFALRGLSFGAGNKALWGIVFGIGMVAVVLFLFVVFLKPYITARTQNLVWGRTRSDAIRFQSTLKARALLWLSIKNWMLVILTLGLYWPFASIARTRMQLEAVGMETTTSLDALVSQARSKAGDAAGDAAGDLFGLDIGF